MSNFTGYRCSLCGEKYSPDEITYTCPKDGGNLDVILDYEGIKKKYQPEDITSRDDPSLWRYLPLLPVPEPPGNSTPLHAAKPLRHRREFSANAPATAFKILSPPTP